MSGRSALRVVEVRILAARAGAVGSDVLRLLLDQLRADAENSRARFDMERS